MDVRDARHAADTDQPHRLPSCPTCARSVDAGSASSNAPPAVLLNMWTAYRNAQYRDYERMRALWLDECVKNAAWRHVFQRTVRKLARTTNDDKEQDDPPAATEADGSTHSTTTTEDSTVPLLEAELRRQMHWHENGGGGGGDVTDERLFCLVIGALRLYERAIEPAMAHVLTRRERVLLAHALTLAANSHRLM